MGSEEAMDINISPLIDMVFILLIFFIVTTVFVEETGVEVEKPEAASAMQLDKNSVPSKSKYELFKKSRMKEIVRVVMEVGGVE